MKRLNVFDWIAFALVIAGGLYWGLIGFLNFDILVVIFGETAAVSRIVYGLVGIAAIYLLFSVRMFARRKRGPGNMTDRDV
jgi:uncharacterized membrane protein YuzA (DUF378 family)